MKFNINNLGLDKKKITIFIYIIISEMFSKLTD